MFPAILRVCSPQGIVSQEGPAQHYSSLGIKKFRCLASSFRVCEAEILWLLCKVWSWYLAVYRTRQQINCIL
jgi:hypothetical protein